MAQIQAITVKRPLGGRFRGLVQVCRPENMQIIEHLYFVQATSPSYRAGFLWNISVGFERFGWASRPVLPTWSMLSMPGVKGTWRNPTLLGWEWSTTANGWSASTDALNRSLTNMFLSKFVSSLLRNWPDSKFFCWRPCSDLHSGCLYRSVERHLNKGVPLSDSCLSLSLSFYGAKTRVWVVNRPAAGLGRPINHRLWRRQTSQDGAASAVFCCDRFASCMEFHVQSTWLDLSSFSGRRALGGSRVSQVYGADVYWLIWLQFCN